MLGKWGQKIRNSKGKRNEKLILGTGKWSVETMVSIFPFNNIVVRGKF